MPEQSGAVPAPTEVCFDGVFSVLSIHFECTENTCFSFFLFIHYHHVLNIVIVTCGHIVSNQSTTPEFWTRR